MLGRSKQSAKNVEAKKLLSDKRVWAWGKGHVVRKYSQTMLKILSNVSFCDTFANGTRLNTWICARGRRYVLNLSSFNSTEQLETKRREGVRAHVSMGSRPDATRPLYTHTPPRNVPHTRTRPEAQAKYVLDKVWHDHFSA